MEILAILNLTKDTRYLPLRKKGVTKSRSITQSILQIHVSAGPKNVYIRGHKANNVILSYRTSATEINFNLVIDFVADQAFNG